MGRKSIKEDNFIINALIHGLSNGMSDAIACNGANISLSTYRKHYNSDQNFRELCDNAKLDFKKNNYEKIFNRHIMAIDYVDRLLRGEVVKKTVIETTYPDGSVEVQIRTVDVLPDLKLLERFLPPIVQDEQQEEIIIDVNFTDDLPTLPPSVEMDIEDYANV